MDVVYEKLAMQLDYISNQLGAMREISRAIAEAQDLDSTLELITRRTTEVMQVDSCSIYLYNKTGDKLLLEASTGLNYAGTGQFYLPYGAGLTGWAAKACQAVTASNAAEDPRFHRLVGSGESKFASLMAMPLVSWGKVIGAANVQTIACRDFTSDEIELFCFITELAAIALEKAQRVHSERELLLSAHARELEKKIKERDEQIAKRECIEEALRLSEASYRTLFEGVPIGLYRTAPTGWPLDVNQALVTMLGYPNREALLAVNLDDLYVEADSRTQWRVALEERGVLRDFEVQLRRYDGGIIWANKSGRLVRDHQNRALCYEGSLKDITERKTAEAALQKYQTELLQTQQRMIAELSSPIIPVTEGVIVLPLIGSIDDERAKNITESLLAGISRHRATIVIIDITGVTTIDSKVALHLNKTIQATRLKGAQAILSGVSDRVAETIVELGLAHQWMDSRLVAIVGDLQAGLNLAWKKIRGH